MMNIEHEHVQLGTSFTGDKIDILIGYMANGEWQLTDNQMTLKFIWGVTITL